MCLQMITDAFLHCITDMLQLRNAAIYRGGARSNRDYNAYDGGDEYYGNKPYYNEDGPPGDDPWGDFSPGTLLFLV
jgi:endonuclease I